MRMERMTVDRERAREIDRVDCLDILGLWEREKAKERGRGEEREREREDCLGTLGQRKRGSIERKKQ
jgi:hypothetical protein